MKRIRATAPPTSSRESSSFFAFGASSAPPAAVVAGKTVVVVIPAGIGWLNKFPPAGAALILVGNLLNLKGATAAPRATRG